MMKNKNNPRGMRTRRDWGTFCPVERVVQNKKKYDRKKQKQLDLRNCDKMSNTGFDEKTKIASVKKIKLFGNPTMSNCSGWYIPDEDILLYFSNMGHKQFVRDYFSKEPKLTGNKIADKIISETRDKLNIDKNPVGYHSFLGLGWIRIYNPSKLSIFLETSKRNLSEISNALDIFME